MPSLWNGLMVDDYFQWALATQSPLLDSIEPSQPGGLFSFLDGNPQRALQMMNQGLLPWWTDPNIKLSFWRPVAEATHWLDYYFWPDNALLMHLHSLLYLFLLLLSTLYLYRHTIPGRLSWLLAALVFAVSYTHAVPTGWLVNRNALLAVMFLTLTLTWHYRWRNDGTTAGAALALLCFVLALLSGEIGVCTGLYLLAYACVFESGLRNKVVSLAPYLIAGGIWLAVRSGLGYGAEYSDHYLDPIASPQQYFMALPERLYQFVVGLFAVMPPTFQDQLPIGLQQWLPAFLLLLLCVSLPLLKRSPWARFWLLGSLTSLLPVACTLPGNGRLLIASSVGASAFVALLLHFFWQLQRQGGIGRKMLLLPLLLLLSVLHLPLAGYLNVKTTMVTNQVMQAYLNRPALDWETSGQTKTAVLVNAPLTSFASFVSGVRAYHQKPVTEKVWALASGYHHLLVSTIDEFTLEVFSPDGLYGEFEGVFRSSRAQFKPGDQVRLDGLVVTIEEVNQGGVPSRAHFRFSEKLADENYQVLHWYRSQFKPCRLPEQNTTIQLALGSSYCT